MRISIKMNRDDCLSGSQSNENLKFYSNGFPQTQISSNTEKNITDELLQCNPFLQSYTCTISNSIKSMDSIAY